MVLTSTLTVRKLRTQWTLEAAAELNAMHGVNGVTSMNAPTNSNGNTIYRQFRFDDQEVSFKLGGNFINGKLSDDEFVGWHYLSTITEEEMNKHELYLAMTPVEIVQCKKRWANEKTL